MAVTPLRMYHDTPPNGDTTIYTATELTVVQVILCTNTTGAAQAVSVRLDPVGGAGSEDLVNTLSVPANDAIRLAGPITLEVGDALVARNHNAALPIAVLVNGFELT